MTRQEELDLVAWVIDATLEGVPKLQPNMAAGIKNHVLSRYNTLRLARESGKKVVEFEPKFGDRDNQTPIFNALKKANGE